MPQTRKRWTVLAMMFLIGLAVAMQVQSVQALAPFLVDTLGFSYAQIGVLLGLFMLPGVFVALPGGMLAARLGDRITMAIALVLVLASALAIAAAESYSVMVVARLVGGIGGAVLTTQPLKVVTDWFAGREISTAMATNAASFGVGIGLSTGLLSAIADWSSWQAAMLASAALVAVALFMVVFNYSDPQPGEGGRAAAAPAAAPTAQASQATSAATPAARPAGPRGPLGLQLNRHEFVLALLAAVLRMCFASGYVVFMSFAPVLLISRGVGAAQAGFLVSLSAVAALVSVPLGGVLTDRTKKPNWFITGGALGAAAACLMLPLAGPALLWILLFGVLRGGCTGGIMSLPSEVLRPGSRNAGFGVSSTMYFLGLSAIPPLAGWILDTTQSPAAPLMLGVGLWLLIPLTLLAFRLLQRRWIVAPA